MKPGSIAYFSRNGLLIIKLAGAIRVASRDAYRLSAAFEALVRGLPAMADLAQILIDLTDTASIDSTNLGLLAQIAQFSRARWNRRPTIISTNRDISVILESVGFDQVFLIVNEADCPETGWQCLQEVQGTERDQLRLTLEAHRALIAINPANRAQFRDVIELLEQESRQQRADSSAAVS